MQSRSILAELSFTRRKQGSLRINIGKRPMQTQPASSWHGVDGIVVGPMSTAVADALSAERLNVTFDQIAQYIRELIGAHQSAVSYIPDGSFTRAVHGISLSDKYAKYRTFDVMPTGKGIWAVVLQTAKAMRLTEHELESHPRFCRFSDLKDARGLEHPPMRGWLAVPVLKRSGATIGLLQLTDRYEGDFTEQDQAMLEKAAGLIAPTMEAEYLYERSQQQQQMLQRSSEEIQAQRSTALNLARDAEDARKRLEQIEERLTLALKSSGVGTWSWNIVENSIFWDDFIHPLFGLEPGTFPGRYEDFLNTLHTGDRQRVTQEVADSVQNDAVYDTEYRVIWPDGSTHVLGSRGKVYRDASGRALRMTGVCWDITERKRLEIRFRAAVESAPAAMVMVDALGSIVLVNHQTEVMFGYPREELLGKPVETLIPERFRPGHPQLRNSFFANPHQLTIGALRSLVGRRRDGTELPIDLGLNPIQTEEGMFVLAAVVDISERKHAEETMTRQAVELARSNKELEQFAYIASHDLQEPLRKVQSFGDLLAAKVDDVLGAEGRDYLHRMQNAAHRMQDLVNDLLTYSRVATQSKPFVSVDLVRVAREVLSDLEIRIQSTGGMVNLGTLPVIDADEMQMRQLLQNLIGNALKFRRKDMAPVVVVHGRVAQFSEQATEEAVSPREFCEITVLDNGIGFDEKYLDRIFSPFQRLHGRGEYEGTGIGLAICRKIVERHRGTITARSTPGEGSTFIVTLPLRHSNGASHA